MALFTIGDLHLSLKKYKPMDIFGEQWENHHLKIKDNWIDTVNEDDTVLVLGDISWAMSESDAEIDLNFIKNLPGRKIFIKGNHDFWWDKTSYLNQKYGESMYFMKNTSAVYKNIAIAGTKGWICDINCTAHDIKIYKREQQRLKVSLEDALKRHCKEIIVIMHYPPAKDRYELSGFIDLINLYPVEKVVYAHLHGADSYNIGIKGMYKGIEYILASSDYLNFKPLKLI